MRERDNNGILTIQYGNYPQTAVNSNLQKLLEAEYNYQNLRRTGNYYTTDNTKYNDYNVKFEARNYEEYEYNGKRYVRIEANTGYGNFILSNGETYHSGDYVWVEVEPIIWLVSEKEKIILSRDILYAGIQFNNTRDYKTRNFDRTDGKQFLDNYFSRSIIQNNHSIEYDVERQSANSREHIRKKNPYKFEFEQVSEEDIIKGSVMSNIAVFLHGPSSEGKSARTKQLDPDCEIIYLRNATPESLNGKSVYDSQTKEMIDIPPTWYQKIVKKCEAEPEKIHIVFFDEITNALHSIQGMAFNIILDKEVNGIWKLPENCRIVAAGNDLNDSLAANLLAEPLFNRFAHVYIKTTVNSWLNWASTSEEEYERLDYQSEQFPSKIHPAIYAYIAFKGESVLRSKYTGEKPNADPRKWEMASKILYKTKNPEMLRALVGEEITRDFVCFCKQQVIQLEDVISGNYDEYDFEMNTSEKFATAVGLSSCNDEDLEVVRNFVAKLGPEIVATFDNLWIHNDETRLERIAELRMESSLEGGKVR